MLPFNTLVVSASVFARLVAATPAPPLSALLAVRQSATSPTQGIPDKCISICQAPATTLQQCEGNLTCTCPVDINPCYDCIAAADSSKKKLVDAGKQIIEEGCKAAGVPTPASSASNNGATQFTAKSSVGLILTFGVATLVAL
ncbi:hypothetical protein DL96DRAFT_1810818 [Flagelloscypha sp. PMI_526]|nr:hypothetical protein DL96DRAFT_1810818 [Flagelloscypha sp. PMI_526]